MKQTLSILLAISLFTMLSCKKEGCTYEDALNYNSEAEKDDGSCVFPEPAPDPEPDPRDPYLGNYIVTDSAYQNQGGNYVYTGLSTYIIQISTEGTIADTLYINNLWGSSSKRLVIVSNDFISMPDKEIDGVTAGGQGDFSANGKIYLATDQFTFGSTKNYIHGTKQ